MKPILLVLTGGTICSFGDDNNENRDVDVKKAKRLILEMFEKSDSPYKNQDFETEYILDTLSENMTVEKWKQLIMFFEGKDLENYSGVIIAHGTDTLAYTSSLMALYFNGRNIPVFLVSSQLPLNSENANGNDNFREAVSLINLGVAGGVFVPYKNSDGKMYIHAGAKLKQCRPYSDDFFSMESVTSELCKMEKKTLPESYGKELAVELNRMACKVKTETDRYIEKISRIISCFEGKYASECQFVEDRVEDDTALWKRRCEAVAGDVIVLEPYVGLDYSRIKLDGVRAIVHRLYHSSTACVERRAKNDTYSTCSVLYLIEQCKKKNIPVIVTPCREDSNDYISGKDMVEAGAVPVYGTTLEMLYVMVLWLR